MQQLLDNPMMQRFAIECTSKNFFGLPPWYKYVCGKDLGQPQNFIGAAPLIMLAIIEILLRIAGTVAVAFVVFGAVKYVVSQGEPDKVSEAKGTIINALAGLVISAIAIGVVAFLGNRIG